MRNFYKILLILLLLPLGSGMAVEPFWEHLNGPDGGMVYDFIEKNNNLYISSGTGLYRSINNGLSWELVYPTTKLSKFTILDDMTYAIICYNDKNSEWKLLFTYDGGKSWIDKTKLIAPSTDAYCGSKLISDSSGKFYYVIAYRNGFYVLYSFDKGISFNSKRFFVNYSINDLIDFSFYKDQFSSIIGDIDNYYYLLLLDKNFNITESIKFPIQITSCNFINDSNLVAFGSDLTYGPNLIYSKDRGKTWFYSQVLDTNQIWNGTNILVTTDSRLYFWSLTKFHEYQGFYTSINSGVTWTVIPGMADSLKFYIIGKLFQRKNGDILVTGSNGIAISNDSCKSLKQFNNGIQSTEIKSITFDKAGNIYVVDVGLYKSTDNGESWKLTGFNKFRLSKIMITKNNDIFVTSNLDLIGIARSTDAGKEWTISTNGLIVGSGYSDLIWDLLENKRGYILAGSSFAKYYLSTDNGDTWVSKRPDDGGTLSLGMNNRGDIFRGGENCAIQASFDDGDTLTNVVHQDNIKQINIHNFFFIPNTTVGYASSFYTTDQGHSWQCCVDDKTIYPNAIDSTGHILGLIVKNDSSKIFRSTNSGNLWEDISSGYQDQFVNNIVVSPNGYIFSIPPIGGLYRSKQKYITSVETPKTNTDEISLNIAPNPANQLLITNYRLPNSVYVKLTLFNLLGQEIATLKEGFEESGIHHSEFSIQNSEFSIGVYFLRLEAGKEVKCVLVNIIR